jgi:predicted secreted hydrolase
VPQLQLASAPVTGFAKAYAPRPFQLPLDNGPHVDFQTEWWYYTGNLQDAAGRHFGYQLTFFRRGLTPGAAPPRTSSLATNQIYFAHFAITDVAGDKHHFAERFSRGAAGLAGASGAPYQVWLEDWRADSLNADGTRLQLHAKEGDFALDLTLDSRKPIVAHGDRGLSPKSAEAGNASYYLSYTRMNTTGTITLNGTASAVAGTSWFDHEWSTSALGPKAVGWDWFSLQLDDEREIMFFQMRRTDGTLEPVSGGTLVAADGSTRRLAAADVQLSGADTWHSPATGAAYPSAWRVVIPSAQLDLRVQPWLAQQEMLVSFAYWEGAVQISGTSAGQAITGNGYVELTGYAGSLQGQF